ncbi:uncharacterized protein [Heterodontus francisci]|uniref:uncharacterized protein n=1 Tax=Heterodontus francisci TaxID=7792 RepID=UPI00355B499A
MQRDLGVLVHESLNVIMQLQHVIRKAYRILLFIVRGIEYKSRSVMLQFYRELVRPHLKYCAKYCCLYLRKNVNAFEAVQRMFTGLMPGMGGLSHEERLDKLGLNPLEFCRVRGNLNETYNFLRFLYRMDILRFKKISVFYIPFQGSLSHYTALKVSPFCCNYRTKSETENSAMSNLSPGSPISVHHRQGTSQECYGILQFLFTICKAHGRSVMAYSPFAWMGAAAPAVNKLDTIQGKAARLIGMLSTTFNVPSAQWQQLHYLKVAPPQLTKAPLTCQQEHYFGMNRDHRLQTVGEDRLESENNVTTMDLNQRTMDWNVTTMGRSFSSDLFYLSTYYNQITLEYRIYYALLVLQYIYYPLLAIVGVPVNLLTIVILSRGKCGLSKCVTCYLVAMAAADLLVIILDLILRQIPIVYEEEFQFLYSIHVCNIHAILVYTATDCSVWFTITFTIDRFVAICCQKLKSKYCSVRAASVVLGTVTVLSFLKNIPWYFMITARYWLVNRPWFCEVKMDAVESWTWLTIEFLYHIVTPGVPFVVILLLNAFTIRHIVVSSRGRRRLRAPSSGGSHRDPEMESRRKSIILLSVISANFILLWAAFMVNSIWNRMRYMVHVSVILPGYLLEAGFMLQLLSCCTNTAIYAVTQTQFRVQLKNSLKYPFTSIVKFIQ